MTPRTPRGFGKAALRGKLAKKNGQTFENEIENSCDLYREQGIAVIARNYPRVAGPPGRMFPAGKGEVDFVGHVCGAPIAFDAKSSAADLKSWKYPERDLHQVRFLLDWKRLSAGRGQAFILLRQDDRAYFIYDLQTLADGNSVEIRTRRTKLHKPQTILPYIARLPDECGSAFWPFLGVPHEAEG